MAGTTIYWDDPDEGGLRFVEFDIVTTLSPEDPVAITDHPVESGSNTTDHARREPTRLTIEAKVSTMPRPGDEDVSLSPLDLTVQTRTTPGTKTISLDVAKPPIQPSIDSVVGAAASAIGDAISGGPKATVIADSQARTVPRQAQAWLQSSPRNRVRDVYEKLLSLIDRSLVVSVTTTMRDYFDMMIERLGAPQTVEDGNAVRFVIDMKRIRVADSETVQSPKPTEARGATGKNKGSQNGKNDPNAEGKAQVYESTISQITPG